VFDPLNASFLDRPFDWERIRARAGVSRVYHGANDPYVPLDMAQALASELQAPLTIIPNGGHLNALAGFTKFDKLLQDLRSIYPWLEERESYLPAGMTRT